MLATIHVQTLFLSVAACTTGDVQQNMLLVQAERRMMRQARRWAVIDSAKFGQQALSSWESSEIDTSSRTAA